MKIKKLKRNRTKYSLFKLLLLNSKAYYDVNNRGARINYSDFEGNRGDIFINKLERIEFSFKSLLKIIHFYHFNKMNIVFIGVPLWYKKQFDIFLKNKSSCYSIFNNPDELLRTSRKDFVKQINYHLTNRTKTKQRLLILLSNNSAYEVPTLRIPTLRIDFKNSKLFTRIFMRLVKAILSRPQKTNSKTRKNPYYIKRLPAKSSNIQKTRRGKFNKKHF